jgi:hypothetical protein
LVGDTADSSEGIIVGWGELSVGERNGACVAGMIEGTAVSDVVVVEDDDVKLGAMELVEMELGVFVLGVLGRRLGRWFGATLGQREGAIDCTAVV